MCSSPALAPSRQQAAAEADPPAAAVEDLLAAVADPLVAEEDYMTQLFMATGDALFAGQFLLDCKGEAEPPMVYFHNFFHLREAVPAHARYRD